MPRARSSTPAMIARRDRGARRARRRPARRAGHRHHQALARRPDRRGHRGPQHAVCRADAAGLPLRARSSRPTCGPRALPREFTDDAAIAEWAGLRVALTPGEPRQHQDHPARGFRPRRAHAGRRRAHGNAHRHWLRRPPLRARRCRLAGRRAHSAHGQAQGALRRRRGAARADRRDLRRARRRRHRHAFPAVRSAVERRGLDASSSSTPPELVAEARRPHRQSRPDDRLRSAADRPACRRRCGRPSPRRCGIAPTASRSRQPQASSSGLPGAEEGIVAMASASVELPRDD